MSEVQAARPPSVREYETIYVLRPEADAESADRVAARVGEVMTREGGKLVKVESWGRRRLAYDVGRHKRAAYVYLKYLGGGRVVSELERNLRMLDPVLKFQTVLCRKDVDPSSVAVDPEEVRFARLEPPGEEDRDESRERALGLVDVPESPPPPPPPVAEDEEVAPADEEEKGA